MVVFNWASAAALLLVAFPVLVIVLGEITQRVRDRNPTNPFLTPLSITRNGVLPLAFLDGALRIVGGWDGEQLAVKIADTGFWIVTLNAVVALLNILFFGDEASFKSGRHVPRLLLDLGRLLLVGCGAAVIVSHVWGLDLSSLITALGVGSVVLGLALQDTLGSIFAGIALAATRHVHVGDWVKYGSQEGQILSMNWRSVKIRTRLGEAVFVPNGEIAKAAVAVLGNQGEPAALVVRVKFPYDYSPEVIMVAMQEAARRTAGFLLTPSPKASISDFAETGIEYLIVMRSADPATIYGVRGEFYTNLWFQAQRRGLSFQGALNTTFGRATRAMHTDDGDIRLAGHLARCSTLRLDPGPLARLAHAARFERYRANEIIVAPGQPVNYVHVLVSGRALAIFKTDDGREVRLHEFEPDQLIVVKSFLQRGVSTLTFKAVDELEAVAIPVSALKAACAAQPALAREIEQMTAAREDAANELVKKAVPDLVSEIGLSDRVQLMREMFQS
jgi:small-conductance mechanosensitive channel/CRP-like cAMP-binding protein